MYIVFLKMNINLFQDNCKPSLVCNNIISQFTSAKLSWVSLFWLTYIVYLQKAWKEWYYHTICLPQDDCQELNKIFSYAVKDGLQYCFASHIKECLFHRFAFILHCSQITPMYRNFQIQLTSAFTLLLTNIEKFLIA